MKITKLVTLLVMVFTLAFAGFAQDSTKTEAPKTATKHHVVKKGTKKATTHVKKSKKAKTAPKKTDADTSSTPQQ